MNKLSVKTLIKNFLIVSVFVSVNSLATEAEILDTSDRINQGRVIAYERGAGNCLSCHLIVGTELPGNIGPPLIHMKLRYPERSALISQISDASIKNPNTLMPPYGRHNLLTDDEIELVVDFIHSL
ncbi:MAG: sulfur-oxidizing protein SoxX [Flavobacterium sp.]|jgi:sulfur-oxidizing protein SoxX